ncbi:AAA family ATPase [Pandoraea apista]|uniref:AAA family ATPase n=1 Tax=Pandoraea apista TaxID=93218 RepID=UPI000F619479|nr:AAA family ATPase [Pandoraea apista]RRJ34366.1 topoisomerase [Pandoraea apista]RRJ81489.1 topoisomerase [Pandoraea apista]RSD16634.1 topoisomerase [Pandoraea apista]RSK87519.1 topoisomerase [Pandoraea apista]
MNAPINFEQQFAAALAEHALCPPEIVGDGKLHRFDGPDEKRGKRSAWYVLHSDALPAGSFGDWRTGLSETWCAKSERSLSPEERQAHRATIQAAKEAEAKARAEVAAQAQAVCQRLWDRAGTVHADQAYLKRKGIKPTAAKQMRDALLIPLRDASGELRNLQFIQPDGTKRFKSGAPVTGNYCSIGGKPSTTTPLLICEGWATACSLHEATGYPVAAAMNAGNLFAVATSLRAKLLGVPFVICADDDHRTEGNPGLTKATEAAKAIGASVAVPHFAGERPEGATDFNDLACLDGTAAVLQCIKLALDTAKAQPKPESKSSNTKRPAPTVVLSRASDIAPEPIYWLWPGWLPAGKLSILAGQPGCGKTTIAISLSAAISKGGEWPDGAKCTKPGNVLIWTGEDGLADTLVPRLLAAGADCSRVYFIESVTNEIGELQPFDPSRDVQILSERIEQIGGASLLVVDPIISVVQGDSHKSGDVRKSLQPLIDLGAARGCAILGITHFSKGSKASAPTERILGSQAFGAAARMILIAGKDESSDRRIFAKSKCNIAGDTGGFEYAIEVLDTSEGLASSRIAWGQPLDGSARDILREIEADEVDGDADDRESKFDRARTLLYELLRPFMSTREIKAAAQAEGFSWRIMESAKAAEVKSGAKIRAVKHGKEWGWIWDDYDAHHPAAASVSAVHYVEFGNNRQRGTTEQNSLTENSTPQKLPDSSPQEFQVRKVDCGVESQYQQGVEAKSATPQCFTGDDGVGESSPQNRGNSATPKNLCGLADLTGNPCPARESTPHSSPQSENDCGLESDGPGGEL